MGNITKTGLAFMVELSQDYAQERDAGDPLKAKKEAFVLPKDVIYLDGNSLGPLTKNAETRIRETTLNEWGHGLIRSWNDAGWIDLPQRIGGKIAALIGAKPDSVIMADSTSVNLFKVLSAVCALRPDRKKIITERQNFPTDNYIIQGVVQQLNQEHQLHYANHPDDILALLDQDVAAVVLTHVNYRNGTMFDMQAITKAAHNVGALVIWDLAHSACAVPLSLDRDEVDFAIGCGYKYLNGGPGAPAFLYAAQRHLGKVFQPLSGWFAHQTPFDFNPDFIPAQTINQFLCGTPPVLSAAVLDAALDVWQDVDLNQVRAKSLALTDYFIDLIDARCTSHGLTLLTPRQHDIRGSQVSYAHPQGGYAIISALIDHGVIGDFRAPDILRFGFTPLYTSFTDVWQAVDKLTFILENRIWDQPQYHARKTVT